MKNSRKKDHGMAVILLTLTTVLKISVIVALCVMPLQSKEIMRTLTEEEKELLHEMEHKTEIKKSITIHTNK